MVEIYQIVAFLPHSASNKAIIQLYNVGKGFTIERLITQNRHGMLHIDNLQGKKVHVPPHMCEGHVVKVGGKKPTKPSDAKYTLVGV